MNYKGQTVLVMGYGISGKSVVNYLLAKEANVILNDRGVVTADPSVSLLIKQGVKVIEGGHPMSALTGVDLIVKSPIIPYTLDLLREAQERQIPILTDVELAYLECKAPIIGITGSNGKTTTTQLIQLLLGQSSEGTAYIAGNIGVPALEVCQKALAEDRVVMELSSFQLMGIQKFRPKIAVFTNFYSAHLDYHGNRQAYIAAKMNLARNLTPQDYLVYNADQEEMVDLFKGVDIKKVPFSRLQPQTSGAYLQGNALYFAGEKVMDRAAIRLPGNHNLENVLAAIAVAKIEGIDNNKIEAIVSGYQGMPHRIQWVGEWQGVTYYNDSKATNTTASLTALNSFKQEILYIGGGLDRGNDFSDLIQGVNSVKAAFLYGQSAHKMAKDFKNAKIDKVQVFDHLEDATLAAIKSAKDGQVVLFSPACASWDQFKNYEERGEAFMQVVNHYYDQKGD
ncbi:UDP-N-acetylmuramoyl-L-alanine--D-glutamate ligase [Facklamia languida]